MGPSLDQLRAQAEALEGELVSRRRDRERAEDERSRADGQVRALRARLEAARGRPTRTYFGLGMVLATATSMFVGTLVWVAAETRESVETPTEPRVPDAPVPLPAGYFRTTRSCTFDLDCVAGEVCDRGTCGLPSDPRRRVVPGR